MADGQSMPANGNRRIAANQNVHDSAAVLEYAALSQQIHQQAQSIQNRKRHSIQQVHVEHKQEEYLQLKEQQFKSRKMAQIASRPLNNTES